MRKLLIADSSEIFLTALEAALQDRFQIRTCADGVTLEQLLREYQPDVLILNLLLPYQDGITALQKSGVQPSVILAIVMHMSAYVEHAVTALGVDYTMIAPSVEAVVLRLQDLLTEYAAPVDSGDIHALAAHHLDLLHIPSHLDGYRQLCLALPMFARDPHQRITKDLYPQIAKLSGCNDLRNVEHSIRKAIRAAWLHRDNAVWRKYFAFSSHGTIPCPTNKAFISRLAELLRMQTDYQ